LGPVDGRVVVPWRFSAEVFEATLSVDLRTLDTGHPRLDRRLRSEDLLDVAATPHLVIRAARPRPAGHRGWSLTGLVRLGQVSDIVLVTARPVAPVIDSAVVKVDLSIGRREFGLTRYGYRLGSQLRVHIDAELCRTMS
jgi:polyisoprenoid-binding protein YceI